MLFRSKDSSPEVDDFTIEQEEKKVSTPKPSVQIVNEPVVSNHIRKVAPKSVSIKGAVNGTAPSKPEEQKSTDQDILNDDSSVILGEEEQMIDISDENLVENWLKFASRIKDSNPKQSSILQTYLPHLLTNFQVGITLESQLQVDLFQEVKSDLLLFLRNHYKTKKIGIEENIEEQQTQSKPYTNDDKFKFMLQKNPALAKLKQNLNLDFS